MVSEQQGVYVVDGIDWESITGERIKRGETRVLMEVTNYQELASKLAQLTAAQSRVEELERESSLWELRYRGAYETAEKALLKIQELERQNERIESLRAHDMIYMGGLEREHKQLTADNQRLRELLRECIQYLPLRGTTHKTMACVESKLEDRIKAALGE